MSVHRRQPGERSDRPTVVVVGSGVAGLTAAYLLQRRYEVTLLEAGDRLGGHADTHDVLGGSGRWLGIDTGFIVHNTLTYPLLSRLFAELDVATVPTEMSMSISCAGCGLEYAGSRGIGGAFAQPKRAADPRYLAMLGEITRFHRAARRLLAADAEAVDSISLAGFVALHRFSRYLVTHFLVPLVAAVWSTGPELALRYPARYLFRFLDQHGMLRVTGSPPWRTVAGGSRTYVDRAVKNLTAAHVSTPVRSITRHADGVDVSDASDRVFQADHVVIATHPDQALQMLTDASGLERGVLSAIPYSTNSVLLHTDSRLLPRAPRARSSWNYTVPLVRPRPVRAGIRQLLDEPAATAGRGHRLCGHPERR